VVVQEQPKNVEYFDYFGSLITNDAICTREIATAITTFSKKKAFHHQKLDLHLKNKVVKCYIWKVGSYGAETWTLRKLDQI